MLIFSCALSEILIAVTFVVAYSREASLILRPGNSRFISLDFEVICFSVCQGEDMPKKHLGISGVPSTEFSIT